MEWVFGFLRKKKRRGGRIDPLLERVGRTLILTIDFAAARILHLMTTIWLMTTMADDDSS